MPRGRKCSDARCENVLETLTENLGSCETVSRESVWENVRKRVSLHHETGCVSSRILVWPINERTNISFDQQILGLEKINLTNCVKTECHYTAKPPFAYASNKILVWIRGTQTFPLTRRIFYFDTIKRNQLGTETFNCADQEFARRNISSTQPNVVSQSHRPAH